MKLLNIFTIFSLIFAALLAVVLVSADGTEPQDYKCQICRDFVKRVVFENESPRRACRSKKQASFKLLDGCSFMLKEHKLISKLFDLRAQRETLSAESTSLRDVCHHFTTEKVCPLFEETFGKWKPLHADSAGLDLRVSLASSHMNPNSVRLTVVDKGEKHSHEFLNNFSYNANFLHYATDLVVHTGNFPVPFTNPNVNDRYNLTVGELTVPVRVVKPFQGIRAVVIGDPCFSGEYVGCKHGAEWSILKRLTELYNTLGKLKDALHLNVILGDNFYDPLLKLAPQFFTQLNKEALGTPFLTVAGNHDQAQHGMCSTKHEGINTNGASFIQYYGTPSIATKNATSPFDWKGYSATDFDHPKGLAPQSNHYFTTMVGNTAFIGFNGANKLDDTMAYFNESCAYLAAVNPKFVFVLGHWSAHNCGCETGMVTHEVRDMLAKLPGCSQFASKMAWLEGHSHENKIMRPNVGFRFGGAGMGDSKNDALPNFGIPFLDSYNNRIQIWYFPIADNKTTDKGDAAWNALMDCIKTKGGLHQCTHLGHKWLDQPI